MHRALCPPAATTLLKHLHMIRSGLRFEIDLAASDVAKARRALSEAARVSRAALGRYFNLSFSNSVALFGRTLRAVVHQRHASEQISSARQRK
jgi:hypothetical protein